ncbi:MAG TPA: ABATE domain-containing protein [Vicinamibacteria bacterium]|nr:ABATE domain-containing protein [Vicinamibacteria bacterium]
MATPKGVPAEPAFELTGGALCLDFANTLDQRPTDYPKEMLPDYRRLLSWAEQAGALGEAEAAKLAVRAERSRAGATRVLGRARGLREAIFAIFAAAVRAQAPPRDGVRTLNQAIRDAFRRLELQPRGGAYRWQWLSEPGNLEAPLWPVVRSAADLMTSPDLARVRVCNAPNCDWLFLDHSKNQTRRWCDMKTCGNRDKARRFRAARKA